MKIEQFYDDDLAHASYAILSQNQIALIDPARNPQPYYTFAREHNASIVAVLETHPHADFVSSHAEISQTTGAPVYISQAVGADYPHIPFDDGNVISVGDVQLKAIHTPGHSPDSISILLINEQGREYALFSGDTLFVGDVGRPDLREKAGKLNAKREELARQMYRTIHETLLKLPSETLVYPAHGAGSLCGKNMSSDRSSTIGREAAENYALQPMSENAFVELLLTDQPFVPNYFAYNVAVNKAGAKPYGESIRAVPRISPDAALEPGILVVDTRPQEVFKRGHIPGSINIMEGGKFETWLGSIVAPDEPFYLVAATTESLENAIARAAKIGYEGMIKGALLAPAAGSRSPVLHLDDVREHPGKFTIVDIRNASEAAKPVFAGAINIPLPQLRERIHEIPQDKPVLVHCAGGYRSAAGSSMLENKLAMPVYDLSEAVTEFAAMKQH